MHASPVHERKPLITNAFVTAYCVPALPNMLSKLLRLEFAKTGCFLCRSLTFNLTTNCRTSFIERIWCHPGRLIFGRRPPPGLSISPSCQRHFCKVQRLPREDQSRPPSQAEVKMLGRPFRHLHKKEQGQQLLQDRRKRHHGVQNQAEVKMLGRPF